MSYKFQTILWPAVLFAHFQPGLTKPVEEGGRFVPASGWVWGHSAPRGGNDVSRGWLTGRLPCSSSTLGHVVPWELNHTLLLSKYSSFQRDLCPHSSSFTTYHIAVSLMALNPAAYWKVLKQFGKTMPQAAGVVGQMFV